MYKKLALPSFTFIEKVRPAYIGMPNCHKSELLIDSFAVENLVSTIELPFCG